MKRMSIKEFAAIAGVSKNTVTRAFLDHKVRGISEKTRQRIREIAAEVGYQPNTIAQKLRSGNSDIVGLSVAQSSGDKNVLIESLQNFMPFIIRVNELLEENNLHLMLGESTSLTTLNNMPNHLRTPVGGGYCQQVIVLLCMWEELKAYYQSMNTTPIVVDGQDCGLNAVQRDEPAAMSMLIDYLVDLGHKRIAFSNALKLPNPIAYRATEWANGYRKSLKRHGLKPFPGWDGSILEDQLVNDLPSWAKKPTALILYDENMASWAIKSLREKGIRVPEDISIATVRRSVSLPHGHILESGITHVSLPFVEAAERTVDLILAIRDKKTVTPPVKLMGELVPGKTTGPAPAKI